jgi:hypothetical protein
MRSYEVVIEGDSPLLMHADSIEWADRMQKWKDDPSTRKFSKAGDDRSPAFRWLGCVYHDGRHVCIPFEVLSSCLLGGGAMVPVPGKSNKTFKAQTQSGMRIQEVTCPLMVSGAAVEWKRIADLEQESDFEKHQKRAESLGFELFVKRAKIGAAKHVRVRPKFNAWSITFNVAVIDDQITETVLSQVITYAGAYKGLGDWRPGSPKSPGPYGTFKLKSIRKTSS